MNQSPASRGYDLNGQMLTGQVKYVLPVKPSQFIFAGGLYFMNGEEGANREARRDKATDALLLSPFGITAMPRVYFRHKQSPR